jgi:hypothetical protein
MNNKVPTSQKAEGQMSLGRCNEASRSWTKEKTETELQKTQFWKVILQKRGWRSGVRATRAL